MYMPSIFGTHLFDDFMNDSVNETEKTLYGKHAAHLMSTDLKETADGYELYIDLPGFKKEEISAHLKKGYLTVAAQKGLEKDEEAKNGKYLHQERYTGSMNRSYYVGEGLTEEDIHAKYENGILTVKIPKVENRVSEQKKYISIEG